MDFGRSYLELSIPSNGDYAKVPVKGKVSIVGANCPTEECSMEVWTAAFQPKDDDFTTTKGSSVKGLALYNLGIWDGEKLADETLDLGTNQAALKAEFDGSDRYHELTPKSHISGKIHYRTVRLKSGTSDTENNALIIEGQFTSSEVNVKLYVHVWLVDCQPSVSATASCSPGIETNDCSYGNLWSSSSLIKNMDSADICSALQVEDYTAVCTAGSGEFAPFYCAEDTSLSGLTPAQQSSRLDFLWTDADDDTISYGQSETLAAMPEFPVSLTVTNEFDREVKTSIDTAPSGGCPPTALDLFDTQFGEVDSGQGAEYVVQDAPAGDYKFSTSGTHDADLYVSTGFGPFVEQECYPYGPDSNETCELHIDQEEAFNVAVNGYAPSSTYQLKAEVVSLDSLGDTMVWDGTFATVPLVDEVVWPIWM